MMNYLYATVTKILSEPYEPKWKHETYECYGGFGNQTLIFDSKSEAENLKVGHQFLA